MNKTAGIILSVVLTIGGIFMIANTKVLATGTDYPVVRQTQFGKISGQKNDGFLDWKGVPYGGDVSGNNRWKEPHDPTKWGGVKQTTRSLTALQFNNNRVTGKENDALTLDIYRPDNDSRNLPVIVYVHGGNNQNGSSSEISGASFVKKHNAIFVAVNYRLGVLGFNPLAALEDGSKETQSGNYSLLDLHQSLSWVRNNVQNFGGNAENITVAGFSAGGRDVMAMLISPIFKDQFNKAIVFSGGMTLSDKSESQKKFAEALAPLVVKDKVKDSKKAAQKWLLSKKHTKEVRKYLYEINPARLTKLMTNAQIRMKNFPHLYRDGYVIPKAGFDTEKYNSVPVVLFTGSREFSLFALTDSHFSEAFGKGTIRNSNLSKEYDFVNNYGGKLYSRFNLEDSANKMLTQGYHAPIYGMQMDFGNDDKFVGPKMGLLGAFHGVFVPLLDPSSKTYAPYVGRAYQTEGAKDLSTVFQNYIYSFVSNNENTESIVPENWRKYNINQESLKLSATDKVVTARMWRKNYTDKTILKEIKKDKTLSNKKKNYLIKNVLNGRWFSYQVDSHFNKLTDFE